MSKLVRVPEKLNNSEELVFSKKELGKEFVNCYEGPTEDSNWLIKDKLLMSGYIFSNYNEEEGVENINTLMKHKFDVIINAQSTYEVEHWCPDYTSYLPEHVKVLYFPTEDGGIVNDKAQMKRVKIITSLLKKGKKVLVHCYGGHGRSGTLAGIAMGFLYPKLSPNEVRVHLSACHSARKSAYSCSPETEKQYEQMMRLLKLRE